MPRMTGADAIVKSLKNYGVKTVFGLPGGQLDHLFDAFYRDGDIRLIHSRHEQGVAYMAYGAAKSTGEVGVYAVVPGPGLLNSTAALCTAWANNAQVLCISGQIPSRMQGKGYGELHEINDQIGMIRHITKWAKSIDDPVFTSQVIDEAMSQLNTGRPRPVEIEMAMDLMGQEAEIAENRPAEDASPAIDTDLLEKAAKVLGKASHPLIIVGSGAIDARDEVVALAETLQAPVVSKRAGKGIMSAKHYLHANAPMGHALWEKTDAVIAVGSRIKDQLMMWGKDEDTQFIHIDIDPIEISRLHEPDVAVVGDAQLCLQALLPLVEKHNQSRSSREEEMLALRERVYGEMRGHVVPQMAYLDVIRDVLPDDGIFVDEVTQVGFTSWFGFDTYAPRQHITAGEMGTLGFGYATALGVAAVNPGKKVVQISGDGGFMFNVQEMSTAAQYNIPLVTIIFNDNKFGNVQRQQDEWFEGRRICSDLHNPDFTKLAELYGIAGHKADSPETLKPVLETALASEGPAIIEVAVTDRMPTPWKFIMMPQVKKQLSGQ